MKALLSTAIPRASTSSFDNRIFVRQNLGVNTNVRNFLRDFSAHKARARKGETVRIQDREGEFLFTCSTPRHTLLGCAKGRLIVHGDLAQPTLPASAWKASL